MAPFLWPRPDPRRWYDYVDSPLGPVLVVSDGAALTRVHFDEEIDRALAAGGEAWKRGGRQLAPTVAAFEAYFARQLIRFDLPLAPAGTAFQRQVWSALLEVPYGRTSTYGALAAALGRPAASRAVGAANGANPLAIIVPCHRVIGRDGTLTGYGGGLARKEALLGLEGFLLDTRQRVSGIGS